MRHDTFHAYSNSDYVDFNNRPYRLSELKRNWQLLFDFAQWDAENVVTITDRLSQDTYDELRDIVDNTIPTIIFMPDNEHIAINGLVFSLEKLNTCDIHLAYYDEFYRKAADRSETIVLNKEKTLAIQEKLEEAIQARLQTA